MSTRPDLILFAAYNREDVHDIFSPDTRFTLSSGSWGLRGIIEIPNHPGDFIFFVTYGQHQADHIFDEWITEEGVVSWQSQPRQSFRDRRIQQFINHDETSNVIHLFLRTKRAENYTYLGRLKYLAHDPDRENPVYMYWQLMDWPIPQEVLDRLNLELRPADTLRSAVREPQGQYTLFADVDPSFAWRGRKWKIDRQDLVDKVRGLIPGGLPEEALRYRSWYIEIDGYRVSPKWLFHLITDASYYEFDASQARKQLAKIGFIAVGVEGLPNMQRQPRGTSSVVKRHREEAFHPQMQILRYKINNIYQVLAGSETIPSDEVLCDWVHFCYNFGLYQEGQMLFALVTPEQVNIWYYERTKKLARLCAMKATEKE